VYSCGYGYFGQLGLGNIHSSTVPRKIDLVNIIQVTAGEGHSIAVSGTGSVFSWGNNKYGMHKITELIFIGQLGLGDTQDRYTPVHISSVKHIKFSEASCGLQHTTLLTST
jgi:alpha-tubulin suppressor-like RCC1 family protein